MSDGSAAPETSHRGSDGSAAPRTSHRGPDHRASRRLLLATGAVVAQAIILLVALDLDISPHRYLRNDVLFRGAKSIDTIYSYPVMDPSPFSVALPADVFLHRSLRAGQLPLWDRSQGGGFSPLVQGNLGVMFPLRWLTVLLPEAQAFSAFMLLTLYAAFAASFLLMGRLGVGVLGAVFGASVFSFSGLMLGQLLYGGVAVFLFLPWLVLAWLRWVERRTWGRFAHLVTAFGLSFTSGHHMLLASVFLGVAIIAVADFIARAREPRNLLGLAAAALWGAALAAFVLLPFALNISSAWRYKTESAEGLSYQVPDLSGWLARLQALVVDVDAPFLDSTFFYLYLGIPVLLVAGAGVHAARSQASLRFLPLALAASFLVCLPGPWMGFAAGLPPLTWIRPIYLHVILVFVVAVAAAAGLERITRIRRVRLPAPLLAVGVALVAGASLLRGIDVLWPAAAEPIPLSQPYRLLQTDDDTFRITGLWGQNHLPNIAHLTGVEDLRLIAVAFNRRYHEWFQLVDPDVLRKTYPTSSITNELSSPLVGAFNVKYVLAGRIPHHLYVTQLTPDDPFGRFDPKASPVSSANFAPAYRDPYVEILRVDGTYRPRAYLAERICPLPAGLEDAAAWMRAHPQALASCVVVEASSVELRLRLAADGGAGAGTVRLSYPSDSEVRMDARTTRPALLVLNDLYEAGWEATVDGQPAEILPVNLLARGLWLEAGDHRISMRYRPPGFAAGLGISGGALALLVAAVRRRAAVTDSTPAARDSSDTSPAECSASRG